MGEDERKSGLLGAMRCPANDVTAEPANDTPEPPEIRLDESPLYPVAPIAAKVTSRVTTALETENFDDPALQIPDPREGDARGIQQEGKKGYFIQFLLQSTALNRRNFRERLQRQCGWNAISKIADVIEFTMDNMKEPRVPTMTDEKFVFPMTMSHSEVAAFLMQSDMERKLIFLLQYL